MRTQFFVPLGFVDLNVGMPADMNRFARSYEQDGAGRVDFVVKYGVTEYHMDDTFTDGNISATAIELANWVRKLAQGQILSRGSMAQMFAPTPVQNYGYGWVIEKDRKGRVLYYHNGYWMGYQSEVIVFPEEDATIVWTSNQTTPIAVFNPMIRAVLRAIFPDKPASITSLPFKND
jgi:CubicO group peptidase (beta-lactamase class C family)